MLGAALSKEKKKDISLFPTKKLLENAYDIGFYQPVLDPINGLVYSVEPSFQMNTGKVFEPFSLVALRKYLDTVYNVDTKGEIDAGKYQDFSQFHNGKYEYMPLSMKNRREVLINYLHAGQSFSNISFVDVYNNEFNPGLVKDKIVFIGSTATALHDEFFTPVGILDGVKIHMNLVNTILEQAYITYVPISFEYVIIFLLTLLLTLFLMHVDNRIYQLFYSICALITG